MSRDILKAAREVAAACDVQATFTHDQLAQRWAGIANKAWQVVEHLEKEMGYDYHDDVEARGDDLETRRD